MCCANPKGHTPECARTCTRTHVEGWGPDSQPRSAPHGSPAPGMGMLELLPWTQGRSLAGEGKIKLDPCAHHPRLCTLMAMAEAAREVAIHFPQPWPAQRMAFNKNLCPKHPNR